MILARVEPGVTSQLPFTACKLLSLSLPNANTAENLIILCEMFRDDNKRHVNRLDDESLFISGLST